MESIFPAPSLICLVCGNQQKILKRHLAVHHGLTPAHYRETPTSSPITR
jgi:predicted transcriptional regulator